MLPKFTIFIILLSAFFLQLEAQNKLIKAMPPKVEVYYFHPTERCPIDEAIEENTRQTFQTYFTKEVKSGVAALHILNTDDPANSKVVAEFDINAQALFLVKRENGKETKNDLTGFAFDYGKSNPQKFKLQMKEYIEKALK